MRQIIHPSSSIPPTPPTLSGLPASSAVSFQTTAASSIVSAMSWRFTANTVCGIYIPLNLHLSAEGMQLILYYSQFGTLPTDPDSQWIFQLNDKDGFGGTILTAPVAPAALGETQIEFYLKDVLLPGHPRSERSWLSVIREGSGSDHVNLTALTIETI